jgi:hypothetical protein
VSSSVSVGGREEVLKYIHRYWKDVGGGCPAPPGAGPMLMNSDDDGLCCWKPNITRITMLSISSFIY